MLFCTLVFLSFFSSKAILFAFSGQRPAVKAPYQLLFVWLQCVCMQYIMGVGLNRILLFQMNWPHVTNTNRHKPLNWRTEKKKSPQMDQQWSEILHVNDVSLFKCSLIFQVWNSLLSFQQTSNKQPD